MKTHTFKITIHAPREKVWETLWNDASYRAWTSVFSEGSRAESDWEEGSRIVFADDKHDGMIAIIEKKQPNEYMGFRHIGTIKNGQEDLNSDEVKKWAGARENYTLQTVDGKTELTVNMDLNDEYKDYFLKTWPLALDKVKELSEQ